jgi:hypothetical protein
LIVAVDQHRFYHPDVIANFFSIPLAMWKANRCFSAFCHTYSRLGGFCYPELCRVVIIKLGYGQNHAHQGCKMINHQTFEL